MNRSGDLIVKKTRVRGNGVFANWVLKKGGLIIRGKPTSISPIRTNYSFQLDFNFHVELDEPARLINHSCEPNLGVKNNSYGGYDFFALKDIFFNEELTWDYCTTEYYSISRKTTCLCGTGNCRGKIKGYSKLPKQIKKKYNNFIANYLKELPI